MTDHWQPGQEHSSGGLKGWIKEHPLSFILLTAAVLVVWTQWGDNLIDYFKK